MPWRQMNMLKCWLTQDFLHNILHCMHQRVQCTDSAVRPRKHSQRNIPASYICNTVPTSTHRQAPDYFLQATSLAFVRLLGPGDRCKDRFKHLIEQQGLLRDFSQFFGTKSVKPSSSTEPNLRLETSSPAMKYDSQQHSDACWTSLRRQKTYDAHLPAQVDPAHFKAPNHTHTSINCPPRTHRAICRCHEPNSGFGSQHHEACCRLSSVVEAH